jgi:hypothetical protein
MSESESANTTGHPTRELITWIVATLTAVVALVGGAMALFHPARFDHPAAQSAALNRVKPAPEDVTVENASAPNGVVAGVINGAVTVGAPSDRGR